MQSVAPPAQTHRHRPRLGQRRSDCSQQSGCRWRQGRSLRKHLRGIWPTVDNAEQHPPPPSTPNGCRQGGQRLSHPAYSQLATGFLLCLHSRISHCCLLQVAPPGEPHPTHSRWATSLCAPRLQNHPLEFKWTYISVDHTRIHNLTFIQATFSSYRFLKGLWSFQETQRVERKSRWGKEVSKPASTSECLRLKRTKTL